MMLRVNMIDAIAVELEKVMDPLVVKYSPYIKFCDKVEDSLKGLPRGWRSDAIRDCQGCPWTTMTGLRCFQMRSSPTTEDSRERCKELYNQWLEELLERDEEYVC